MTINNDPRAIAPIINKEFGNKAQRSNNTAKTASIEPETTFKFMIVFL